MRIAVTGPKGLLGSALVAIGCIPLDVDVRYRGALYRAIDAVNPDAIIHCAAYTNVDGAESDSVTCMETNVKGTQNLVRYWSDRLILLSTDYIFDGRSGPYSEDAQPNPLGIYGWSKLLAEWELAYPLSKSLIVRTTVLYGWHPKPNFVVRTIKQLRANEPVYASGVLVGNPTYAPCLAEQLVGIAEGKQTGVLNLAGPNRISRYEFAKAVAAVFTPEVKKPFILDSSNQPRQGALRPLSAGFNLGLATRLGYATSTVMEGLEDMRRKENAC